MNLGQIRNAILVATNYSPNDTTYHRYVNQLIDQHHRELWSLRQWNFAKRTVEIPVFRDKTSARWSNTYITIANGETTGTTTIDVFQPWDAGQIIEIGGLEYTIAGVISPATISLDRPFVGDSGDYTDWKVKHRHVWLPHDCADVLDVSWRDAPVPGVGLLGTLKQIGNKTDNVFALRLDDTTGKPTHYVVEPDLYIRAPEERLAPVLTLSTSGTPSPGYISSGTYTFTYSYVLGAQDVYSYGLLPESDPWLNTITIEVPTSDTKTINFNVFQPRSIYSNNDKPYRIKIWAVDTLYDGRVVLQELNSADGLGPLYAGSTGQVYIGAANLTPSSRPVRHPLHGGRNMAIRLWPRPDSDDYETTRDDQIDEYNRSWVTVTYLNKPEHLMDDSDVPAIPEEYHQLLIDRIVADTHMQAGNMTAARVYEGKYNARLDTFIARYGSHKDNVVRRGQTFGRFDATVVGQTYPLGQTATWKP